MTENNRLKMPSIAPGATHTILENFIIMRDREGLELSNDITRLKLGVLFAPFILPALASPALASQPFF
jgi:hypothetical protein